MFLRNKTSRKPVGSGSSDRPSNEYSSQTTHLTASPYINAMGSPKYSDSWHREASVPPPRSNRASMASDEFFDTQVAPGHGLDFPAAAPGMPPVPGSARALPAGAAPHGASGLPAQAGAFGHPAQAGSTGPVSTPPTAAASRPSAVSQQPSRDAAKPAASYGPPFPGMGAPEPVEPHLRHKPMLSAAVLGPEGQVRTLSASQPASQNSTPQHAAPQGQPSQTPASQQQQSQQQQPQQQQSQRQQSTLPPSLSQPAQKKPAQSQPSHSQPAQSLPPHSQPSQSLPSQNPPSQHQPSATHTQKSALDQKSALGQQAPNAAPNQRGYTNDGYPLPDPASAPSSNPSSATYNQSNASLGQVSQQSPEYGQGYAGDYAQGYHYPYGSVPADVYGQSSSGLSQAAYPVGSYDMGAAGAEYAQQPLYYEQGNDSLYLQQQYAYAQGGYAGYDPAYAAYYQGVNGSQTPTAGPEPSPAWPAVAPLSFAHAGNPATTSQQSLPYSTAGSMGSSMAEYGGEQGVPPSDTTSSSSAMLPFDAAAVSVASPQATMAPARPGFGPGPAPAPPASRLASANRLDTTAGTGPTDPANDPGSIYKNVTPVTGPTKHKLPLQLPGLKHNPSLPQLSPMSYSAPSNTPPSASNPRTTDSPTSVLLGKGPPVTAWESVAYDPAGDTVRAHADGGAPTTLVDNTPDSSSAKLPSGPASPDIAADKNAELGIGKGSEYVRRMRADAGETHTSRQPSSLPLGLKRTTQKSPLNVKPEFLRRAMDIRYTHLPQRMLETEVDDDDDDDELNSTDDRSRGLPMHHPANISDRVFAGSHPPDKASNSPRASPRSRRSSSPVDSIIEQTGKIKLFVANPDDD